MRFILKLIRYIINGITRLYNNFSNEVIFFREKVNTKNYNINGRIFVRNRGIIEIGNNFKANSGKNYNPIGGDIILRLIVTKNGRIEIGNNVGISNSTLYSDCGITIGDDVMIGGGCRLWDTDFHQIDPGQREFGNPDNIRKGEIIIKRKAFIGGSSIILKGVTIGENSIVAAGSVVSKDIPDNEIWGGNPCKFIRRI